ncbi:MAG: DUF1579 family protein [bacterium]
MATNDDQTASTRGYQHEALAVFLGRWRAEGKSYGSPNQPADDPKSAAEQWTSTHTGHWHTGEYFLIQDERAMTGASPFDTLSVMGADTTTGRYFARCFENHGFYRHYDVSVDGQVWTLTGESERARIDFSPDGRTQTITWEWRPKDRWLPLCDRIARRED